MSATPTIANALTIAGIDPSGGAGVLADIKTFSAFGVYGCAVVAALTAQNTQAVTAVHAIPAAFVAQQIDTLLADVRIDAVKIGMLGQAAVIQAVAERLHHWQPANRSVPMVLDPVMVAKSGAHLLDKSALGSLREALLPLATVLTPNLPEAGVLLERSAAETPAQMRQAIQALREKMSHSGHRWVYLKGGHLPGDECLDLLHDGDVMIELPGQRIDTKNTHGTGCSLSAALAALLAQGVDVPDAARRAHRWLARAIAASGQLQVGSGHGPVQHFHELWKRQ
jgi:hydroxymethylpyrimidine/phosphomethylpyrimidine kinase